MRTQYDGAEDTAPEEEKPKRKKSRRQLRHEKRKKLAAQKCDTCRHSVLDHQNLAGAERPAQFCHICLDKCGVKKGRNA